MGKLERKLSSSQMIILGRCHIVGCAASDAAGIQ